MVLLKNGWDYVENVAHTYFSDVPPCLRRYALEIECVITGIKPACLIAVDQVDVADSVKWLRERRLAVVVAKYPSGPEAYGQESPRVRVEMLARNRFRLYAATDLLKAKQIADLELCERDMSELGRSLGYPGCCVKQAAELDRVVLDESSRQIRQTNLNVAAVKASERLDPNCNRLLSESEVSGLGPACAIPHYPCKLNCENSAGLGRLALQTCVRRWPGWAIILGELLVSPMFYWDDTEWACDHWNESCGFVLPGGVAKHEQYWETTLPSHSLGSVDTPYGRLPSNIRSVWLSDKVIIAKDDDSKDWIISAKEWGRHWMLEWQTGKIRTRGS